MFVLVQKRKINKNKKIKRYYFAILNVQKLTGDTTT